METVYLRIFEQIFIAVAENLRSASLVQRALEEGVPLAPLWSSHLESIVPGEWTITGRLKTKRDVLYGKIVEKVCTPTLPQQFPFN